MTIDIKREIKAYMQGYEQPFQVLVTFAVILGDKSAHLFESNGNLELNTILKDYIQLKLFFKITKFFCVSEN